LLRGHTAPCRAPTLRRAAPRARPLAGRGAARRLCRNARLPKQPARAPPRTAELDSVPVRASGEARARAPPRANGGAQATARRGRGHRPPAARAHACPARRGVFTPHGRGVGVAVSATRDVPHAVAEAARVCAPPRTVGADSVPQRGRQRHPRAHPPRANGGARAHRARRLDSQPAARAHVHRERWASHPPPRGGVGVANGHTRAPPRACGCRGSPHARAHHRAQTVCAGASLQRAAVAAAARRACARPHAHGSVGASHPLGERGWVWSTATRVAAKGVPRPARTPMGALSPAERPHHTAQKPRAGVLRFTQAPPPPRRHPTTRSLVF